MNAPTPRTHAEAEAIFSKLRRKVMRQTKAGIPASDKELIIAHLMNGTKVEDISFSSPWAANYNTRQPSDTTYISTDGHNMNTVIATGVPRVCDVRADDQARRKLTTVERLKAKLAARK
jgi:hypothetical protein